MSTRVLVVDDEPAVCRMVQTVLESMGVESETLCDSAQAEVAVQSQKFDAIFVDARMPAPDGLQLVRKIRRSGYNQSTPVVMMTGYSEPALLAQAFEAGTNYFLFKPVDRAKLQKIIRASEFTIAREKRRYQRISASLPAKLECKGQTLKGHTIDVSLGGALIQAEDVFPIGSRVRLDIELAPGAPTFRATGYVVRLLEISSMGVQFESLESAESERLQEFLLPYFLKHAGGGELVTTA